MESHLFEHDFICWKVICWKSIELPLIVPIVLALNAWFTDRTANEFCLSRRADFAIRDSYADRPHEERMFRTFHSIFLKNTPSDCGKCFRQLPYIHTCVRGRIKRKLAFWAALAVALVISAYTLNLRQWTASSYSARQNGLLLRHSEWPPINNKKIFKNELQSTTKFNHNEEFDIFKSIICWEWNPGG